MIRFYVVQVQLGHLKLEDVPLKWRKKVEDEIG